MAELRFLGGDLTNTSLHVLFVHGLGGGIDTTWRTKTGRGEELWPLWLLADIPDLAIWAVGYDAAPSRWLGHALPLDDRAENIWSLLRSEPRLKQGHIAFVTHSMGGLVTVQTLRCIERDRAEQDGASFNERVRRIAFLGTPQKGSRLATTLGFAKILFPMIPMHLTVAIHDLRAESPQLRALSGWFRKRVRDDEIEVLQMVEGRRLRFGFLDVPDVVTPGSADAGLINLPVLVDETHFSICRPRNVQSQVFIAIKSFLTRKADGRAKATRYAEEVRIISAKVDAQSIESAVDHQKTQSMLQELSAKVETRKLKYTLLHDEEVKSRLERLRQRRAFGEADAYAEATELAHAVEEGDLSSSDVSVRSEAIAWCARVIAATQPLEAAAMLERNAVHDSEATAIAKFCIRVAEGALNEALGEIAHIASPGARGAAYISIQNLQGFDKASVWMATAGLSFEDLDDNAMVQRIRGALEAGEMAQANDLVHRIDATLLDRSAAANSILADVYMTGAVAQTSWSDAKQMVLVGLDSIALRDDPDSMNLRRMASACFKRLELRANEIGLSGTAAHASDWHLWLDLHDPSTLDEARKQLEKSLESSTTLLRRFFWAHQCRIDVSLTEVDNEINRQVALSGGTQFEHAAARLAMSFAQDNPQAAAAYLGRHREHLIRHLDPKMVLVAETDILAQAGDTVRALDLLAAAEKEGVGPDQLARLRVRIAEKQGVDVISSLRENYQRSGSVVDLRAMVDAHAIREEYNEAIAFGETLLEQTSTSDDARRLAILLYKSGSPRKALDILERFPVLLADHEILLLQAYARYDIGDLLQAKETLDSLRQAADGPQARLLSMKLAITSGDWAALQAFVEEQWRARQHRIPLELLQAGQIAQYIGVARGQALIREAARSAGDDAALLAACYHAATSAGWENEDDVADWLHRATSLSDSMENGPMQRISLDQLLERQPEWEAHEARITSLAMRGEAPLFAVAQALNKTLTRLILFEAFANREQPDVRRRSMLLTTSGARTPQATHPNSIALDPTALLTAVSLNLLDAYRRGYRAIWIAHETLGWLFEEQTQLRFHQPSRVSDAHILQRRLADGSVTIHVESLAAPEHLIRDLGTTLAALLVEASTVHNDGRQRVVVVLEPVWQVGSAMTVVADLSAYHQILCTARCVVDELVRRGRLTDKERERLRSRADLGPMPTAPRKKIDDGAIFLLDDTAASLFQSVGLFGILHQAGFGVVISTSEAEESRQLIEHDARAGEAVNLVEQLRGWLQNGLEEGWIRLGEAVAPDTRDQKRWFGHPSATLLRLADRVDACVVDDRFINQHSAMRTESGGRPILTTWDVLNQLHEREIIDCRTKLDARLSLRRAGYTFAPLDFDELKTFLTAAQTVEGVIDETVELRAIRETIVRARMSEVLQFPVEASWIDNITTTCLKLLQSIWTEDMTEERRSACSDWLFDLSDPRGWAHRMALDANDTIYRNWLRLLVMLPLGRTETISKSYGQWLEDCVLIRLQQEKPDMFRAVMQDVTAWIEAIAARSGTEIPDGR